MFVELVFKLVIELEVLDMFVDMFDTVVFVFVMRLAVLFELLVAEPPHANANAATKIIKPVYNFINYLPFLYFYPKALVLFVTGSWFTSILLNAFLANSDGGRNRADGAARN